MLNSTVHPWAAGFRYTRRCRYTRPACVLLVVLLTQALRRTHGACASCRRRHHVAHILCRADQVEPMLADSNEAHYHRMITVCTPLLRHEERFEVIHFRGVLKAPMTGKLTMESKGTGKEPIGHQHIKSENERRHTKARGSLGSPKFRMSEQIRVSAWSTAITSLRPFSFAHWNAVSPT